MTDDRNTPDCNLAAPTDADDDESWRDRVSPEGRRHLEVLKKMSTEQILAIAVRAGISTPDGQLTANYRHDAEPSVCRPTD
jgi:hypothetical protein